jgi:hypothetical protein
VSERPDGARRGGDAKDGKGAEAHGACLVRVRVRVRVRIRARVRVRW